MNLARRVATPIRRSRWTTPSLAIATALIVTAPTSGGRAAAIADEEPFDDGPITLEDVLEDVDPSEGPHEDALELLDWALEAIDEDDDVAYAELLDIARSGAIWLPGLVHGALETGDEDFIEESYDVLDASDPVLFRDWVWSAIHAESQTVQLLPPDADRTDADRVGLAMVDEQGAALLEVIDRRGIEIPPATRLVLARFGTGGFPTPAAEDYELALEEVNRFVSDGAATRPPATVESTATPTTDAPPTTVASQEPAASAPATTSVSADGVPAESAATESVATTAAPAASTDADGWRADPSDDDGTPPLLVWGALIAALAGVVVAAVAMRRSKHHGQLADIAYTDGLTGLKNRRRLDADIAENRRAADTPTAMLMIDVDHFKQFNDVHGHAMGDEVLRRVGEVLAREFRSSDVPYRYGGEEFCVLLPGTTADEAVAAGERARLAISAIELPIDTCITASVGVSIGPAGSAPDTIARADAALYEAKRLGRDRVVAG